MIATYRSEKKKIIKSQLELVNYTLDILKDVEKVFQIQLDTEVENGPKNSDQIVSKEMLKRQNKEYSSLLMRKTKLESEIIDKEMSAKYESEELRQKSLDKLEMQFWQRRLLNAEYFRQVKVCALGKYLSQLK